MFEHVFFSGYEEMVRCLTSNLQHRTSWKPKAGFLSCCFCVWLFSLFSILPFEDRLLSSNELPDSSSLCK